MGSSGTGPGTITPDGCAVDFYRRLPAAGEPEIVHAAVPAGSSVLELGCGTGRIATPLARLGHRVVGVDESAEMLACCRRIETVRSSIQDLDLDERFDVVLLPSHLVNAGDEVRPVFLDACRRHLAPGGVVVLQRFPPGWIGTVTDFEHEDGVGGVHTTFTVLGRPAPDQVHARIRYEVGDDAWEQEFTTFEVDDEALPGMLEAAGLRLDRILTQDGGWFTATA
jgi:SAM-dependent methyltransferase